MSETIFVLGNGESRKGIQIEDLKQHGKVFACNGVYRTDTPDVLVAVDPKMLLEIAESDYVINNNVWSNFNSMYKKNDKIMNHVQFFQPSLGWSSGPTALKYAADHKPRKIYILGFDYQGHNDKQRKIFNNMFKDTRNYKKSTEEATFFGNWLRQTKSVINENSNTNYIRVIAPDNYNPEELNKSKNYSLCKISDFKKIFQLT